MATKQHHNETASTWTGDRGEGTSGYRSYDRAHETVTPGRPPILSTSDPAFRGDPGRWNPELLLVAALSQCHMLAYLHQCAVGGVVVTSYVDAATGTMAETPNGGGHFEEVVLRPVVTVAAEEMAERAHALHKKASELCFIASSVNFPVHHEPEIKVRAAEPSFVSPPAT
jgi:organic hydroperoxide reductase OsmC/OhrA